MSINQMTVTLYRHGENRLVIVFARHVSMTYESATDKSMNQKKVMPLYAIFSMS